MATNAINSKDLEKLDNDVGLLNIADKYGFGNIIEEKTEPQRIRFYKTSIYFLNIHQYWYIYYISLQYLEAL